MALKQIISTKLEQRLSPQQIQLMKLLQVPTLELEQRIKQEIEENPALEEGLEISEDNYGENEEIGEDIDEKEFNVDDYLSDDSDYKTRINNSSKDNDDKAIPLSVDNSFQERLINQIQLLNFTDQEYIIADIIVGNLDESGYLNRSIEALVDDLAFSLNIIVTEQEVLEVLKIIQDFDPVGIGDAVDPEFYMPSSATVDFNVSVPTQVLLITPTGEVNREETMTIQGRLLDVVDNPLFEQNIDIY